MEQLIATPDFSAHTLDTLLALQCLLAWAGEAQVQPPRMAWWRTSVMDEFGARYTLGRLLPETLPWAELEVIRRGAIAAERRRRRAAHAAPDRIVSLFYWGYDLDQALHNRLKTHKLKRDLPAEALDWPGGLIPGGDFDRDRLETTLRAQARSVEFKTTAAGREVTPQPGMTDLKDQARLLAAALVPFGDGWTMPYLRRGGA